MVLIIVISQNLEALNKFCNIKVFQVFGTFLEFFNLQLPEIYHALSRLIRGLIRRFKRMKFELQD